MSARVRARIVGALFAAAFALPVPLRAQETGRAPIPPAAGYVTDAAGVLGDEAPRLEGFLDQLQKKTGVQFAVLTVASTAPEEPSDYKVRVFQSYGIGDAASDEGLLLLVAMEQRALRFETGYGLEELLPDAWQSRMLRREVVPRFRAGEPAAGIVTAVQVTAARIAAAKGVTLEWDGRPLTYDSVRGKRRLPPLVLALLIFFVMLMMIVATSAQSGRRGRHYRRGPWDGMGGGGFGGWGGGFGGGGGSSFGGFGGGGSGGGGGGAGW